MDLCAGRLCSSVLVVLTGGVILVVVAGFRLSTRNDIVVVAWLSDGLISVFSWLRWLCVCLVFAGFSGRFIVCDFWWPSALLVRSLTVLWFRLMSWPGLSLFITKGGSWHMAGVSPSQKSAGLKITPSAGQNYPTSYHT